MREDASAGAVIFRRAGEETVFLLLKYPSGHWDFAKGRIEHGETQVQAATREVMEETGIEDLAFVDGFEHRIEYDFEHAGESVHKQVVFFLAETSVEDVVLSHEHVDHAWMGFEEASAKVTFANARRVLAGAAHYLARTAS